MHNWEPENVGIFINLRAFYEWCRDRWKPGARLPDWKTIQNRFPELIDRSTQPDRRFISHRWDGVDHPDPTGWQFQTLLFKLACHYNYNKPNLCIWYDYMSLPQKPRSRAEENIFRAGLANIQDVVARCPNILLVSATAGDHRGDLDALLLRGWIVFELYIARGAMKTPLPLFQRESGNVEYGRQWCGWDAIVPNIRSIAPWEDAGQLETWFRGRGIACTNGADLTFLAGLLHDSISTHPLLGIMPEVQFGKPMRLSGADIRQFAFCKECGLSLRRSDLFLTQTDYDAQTSTWTVVIKYRPPALPLDQWTEVRPAAREARMIDVHTGRSPMYPGMLFEFSQDANSVRPTIA